MNYTQFLQILLSHKKFSEDVSELYDLGIDLIGESKYNLVHPIELILETSIKSHYGDDGWEWVSWFIWESDYGQKDFSARMGVRFKEDDTIDLVVEEPTSYGAHDESGNPICYSYESLWEHLETNHKLNKN